MAESREPEQILREARERIAKASNIEELKQVRREYLGKKGILTACMQRLRGMEEAERVSFGGRVNFAREEIETMIRDRQSRLEENELMAEAFDVTESLTKIRAGHRHPVTQIMEDIQNMFMGMGYSVMEGPEVEYDYYNFEALNIPDEHPWKEEQPTFHINQNILLRTQTTPIEIRCMEQKRPPICAIARGRVFRKQELNQNQSPVFHQIEGMVIDRNITFSDLKGTMVTLVQHLFDDSTRIKFRPYKYPYNEPSAKMDVSCFRCRDTHDDQCPICGGQGWIEILGCGMIHPKVLSMSGIDPDIYSGFGFGLDVERIAMLKMEIDDMRLLYENDESFLGQF